MNKIVVILLTTIFLTKIFGAENSSSYKISREYKKQFRSRILGKKGKLEDKEHSPYGGNYFGQYPYYPYWKDAEYMYNKYGRIVLAPKKKKSKVKKEVEGGAIYTVMPYYSIAYLGETYTNLQTLQKTGIYLARKSEEFHISFAYEYLSLGDSDGEFGTLQNGIVFTVGAPFSESFDLTGGIHKVRGYNSDESYYRGNVYIADLNLHRKSILELGVSLYLSKYNDYNISVVLTPQSSGRFTVKQYSPYFSYNISKYFKVKAWFDIIDSDTTKAYSEEADNFFSQHISGLLNFHLTYLYFEVWSGDQRFAVSDNGFNVNSLSVIRSGGSLFYLMQKFKFGLFGKFEYEISRYHDYTSSGKTDDDNIQELTFSLGYDF